MTGHETRGQINHVELYVRDLERSAEWWGWLLESLGYRPYQMWDEGISWLLDGTYIVLVQAPIDDEVDRRHPGLNHLAFTAGSRDEVDQLTQAARDRDERVLYEDRHPFAGGDDHYALFIEDPDGIKVEIVAHGSGHH
ncbi:MAG TPA: VOC family protein [Nitriliruptorales bacterium]